MSTALTLYPFDVAATNTLPSAANMTTTYGTSSVVYPLTALNEATGIGELALLGTSTPWPALTALPYPRGYGAIVDGAYFQNVAFVAGTWQCTLLLRLLNGYPSASATADLLFRVGIYRGGPIVILGTGTLTSQTIPSNPSAPGSYTISLPLPQFDVEGSDHLYVDLWANVQANTSSGTQSFVLTSQSTGQGNGALAIITPGYNPQSSGHISTNYSYGAFSLNDGLNYRVTSKTLGMVETKQTYGKFARMEGVKKLGEYTNERTITVKVLVSAQDSAGRAGLELLLDALTRALQNKQQQLTLHSLDTRYFVADALSMTGPLPAGKIVSTEVTLTFLCQRPYARAATTSSYTTGAQTYTSVLGSQWYSPILTLSGGGTVFARPLLILTNNMVSNQVTTQASVPNGTPSITSLYVTALPHAAITGESYVLQSGSASQLITIASPGASAGSTSLPTVSFTATATYPTGSTVSRETIFTALTVTNLAQQQACTCSNNTLLNAPHAMTLYGDLTDTTNGWTIQSPDVSGLVEFTGMFPILDPVASQFQVIITCLNQPIVTTQLLWTPLYLS